jgi:hypothetical protein
MKTESTCAPQTRTVDLDLLAIRVWAVSWVQSNTDLTGVPVGLLGASTGAGSAGRGGHIQFRARRRCGVSAPAAGDDLVGRRE